VTSRLAPEPADRRARVAVAAIFALNGLLFGSFAARLPAVRDRVGLSDGEQGVALACLAVGAVVAMPLAGALVARLGSRPVTQAAVVAACLATGIVALAASLPALCALALLMGASSGALDVAMNAHGVAVERRYGRPILATFHGFFSLGGLVGGALSALAAALDVDVRAQLGLVGLAGVCVGLCASRWLLPTSADAVGPAQRLFVRPPSRLLTLGTVAFSCLLIEGATADWSAVYLRDDTGASAAAAAIGFTAFSVTMTLARFGGDRLVARLGPLWLLRLGGLLTAVGFGVALAAGGTPAGIAGFACVGAGMAGVFPVVLRAASLVGGIPPGVALAAVTTTGYLGFLAGPALIGGLAALLGLHTALVAIVALALVVAALAPAVRGSRVAPAAVSRV
jgi:MFS family permease